MEKNGIKRFGNRPISRRDMLKLIGTTVGAAALAGCAPKATEVAGTEAPVEVPVTEVPVTEVPVVEAEKVVLRYQNHWTQGYRCPFQGYGMAVQRIPSQIS